MLHIGSDICQIKLGLHKVLSECQAVILCPGENVCMYVFHGTVVWEKLVVGNIHEIKIPGKNFCLSRLQTHYKLLYLCVARKFLCV